MATGGQEIQEHPIRTRSHQYRYLFHPKHHAPGRPKTEVAQWHPDVTNDQEFGVFDAADFNDVLDGDGNLYGVLLAEDGAVLDLGSLNQQIAYFPRVRDNESWHGYPLAPLKKHLKPPHPPVREVLEEVLQKMVDSGWLDETDKKKLKKRKKA